MTDRDEQWAALLRALHLPYNPDEASRAEAKISLWFPIWRETFYLIGPERMIDAMRDSMVDGIDNAIKKVKLEVLGHD